MSGDLKQQLKVVSSRFEHFSIAIYETVDITGIAQLTIFIRDYDSEFNIYEELIELVPMHEQHARTSLREMNRFCMSIVLIWVNLHAYLLKATYTVNMVGKHNSFAAKLQRKLTSRLIICTFSLYYSSVKFVFKDFKIGSQKTVNYIRDCALNHCQLLEDQFTDVPFYPKVHWLCHKCWKDSICWDKKLFLDMKDQNRLNKDES